MRKKERAEKVILSLMFVSGLSLVVLVVGSFIWWNSLSPEQQAAYEPTPTPVIVRDGNPKWDPHLMTAPAIGHTVVIN